MKLPEKESKNLEDHTGYNKYQKLLDILFSRLNPIYAYRNIRNEGAIPYDDRVVTFRRGR